MSAPDFERVFELTVEAVAAGERSVPDSLTEWPDHADELGPLLETVAVMAEAPPPPDAALDERRFEALMTQLRTTPQEAAPPRRWVPSLPSVGAVVGWLRPTRALALPAAAAAVLAIALVLFHAGGNSAEAATLEVFAGTVEQHQDAGWTALAGRSEIREGVTLRTSTDARARLTFADGSSLTIAGSAELTIDRHRAGGREVAVTQVAGRLEHEALPRDRADDTYSISTADATVLTLGASFATEVDAGGTLVSVKDGTATVRAGDASAALGAGAGVRTHLGAILPEQSGAPQNGGDATSPSGGLEPSARLTLPAQFEATLIAPDGGTSLLSGVPGTVDGLAGATLQLSASAVWTLEVPGSVSPGTYRLVLTRVAGGAAQVTLTSGSEATVVALDAASDHIELEIEIAPGGAGATLALSVPRAGGVDRTQNGSPTEPALGAGGSGSEAGSSGSVDPSPQPTADAEGGPGATPSPTSSPAASPEPTEPAPSSGVRGRVLLVSTCVPLLGATCSPLPDAVTLIVESAAGSEVARLKVASGSELALPLAPGNYQIRVVTIGGLARITAPPTPFAVTSGAWTQLDLAVALAP